MVKSMIGMIALKLFFNIFLFVLGATFIGSVMSDLREGKWPLHEWVAILCMSGGFLAWIAGFSVWII